MEQIQLENSVAWRQRYQAFNILRTTLAAANRDRGLAITNRSGRYQLYAWDVPSGDLRQLTDSPTGVSSGVISPDGRFVYYLKDKQGNEIGHFVRVPFEGGDPVDITPTLPPYASLGNGPSISRDGQAAALSFADQSGFHVFGTTFDTAGQPGQLVPLFESKRIGGMPLITNRGEIVYVHSSDRSNTSQYSLLAFDPRTGEKLAELWDGAGTSVEAEMVSPLSGDVRVLASTDKSGLNRPVIWNPLTGERTDLALADLAGEVTAVDWSEDGQTLLLGQVAGARIQLYLYELSSEKLTRLDQPGGSLGQPGFIPPAYFGTEGRLFAHWQDATHPPQLLALDGQTGHQLGTLLEPGPVPPSQPWESVTFPSSDGEPVQAWLSKPANFSGSPVPTVLHIHGGPHGVTVEIFSPAIQAFLDHGFAVLSINYRGSTTFGSEFAHKIAGKPGYWEHEDMLASRKFLVESGIADPKRIFLNGGSYGGYLTLLGLGKTPDLWAGGMALVAIADWTEMYADEAPTLQGAHVSLFGGRPDETPEQHIISSPITYAEHVVAPVLIIQGRNDTRTPARQLELYEMKMRGLGKPVELHWFEAGHVIGGSELGLQHMELMLDFAGRVLQEIKD
jgi:dipeptidyl aminopeptidase/acylaminoacyl peptidase